MKKKLWVYDTETLTNLFTATFIDVNSDEKRVFVLSNTRDDITALLKFLKEEVRGLIGYNCINFDSQILEYIFRNPKCTANDIRNYAVLITSSGDRRLDVPEWRLKIPHLDLFRALSLSVSAKRTSLKWCEFMLDMENIEDMPSQGEGDSWEEQVLAYNLNDVISTKRLYEKYKYEIELRQTLSKQEGVNLMNSSEPDMARKLFSKYLSKAMNIPENDLRIMSTHRDVVSVKDIIFPYINFQTEKFKKVKEYFESLSLSESDKADIVVNHQGVDIVFGLGGIHAAMNNKLIESDNEFIIKSLDVEIQRLNLVNCWKAKSEMICQSAAKLR